MLLFVSAAVLAGLSCQHHTANLAGTSRRNPARDEAAIRELFAGMERAGNEKDQARVAAAYTPDGDIWMAPAFGKPDRRVVGVENIRWHLESGHGMPGEKLRLTVDGIRFLTSDVALVDGTSTSTHDAGINRATATLVVVRHAEGWKLAAARVMKLEKLPQQVVSVPMTLNIKVAIWRRQNAPLHRHVPTPSP